MPGMMGLLLNNLAFQGAQGGALPEIIEDDFSADSGLWLDGDLQPAAMTVDGGRGIWTPTEGAEINTSSNAAADPNGTEANATTGWGGVRVDLSVESVDVDTGSYALKVVSLTGQGDRATLYKNDGSRGFYIRRIAAKNLIGNWELRNSSYAFNQLVPLTTSWADYITIHYKASDYHEFTVFVKEGGSAGDTVLIDNVSIKPIEMATVFRVQRIYYPSVISAAIRWMPYCVNGVVCYKDSDNYVAAVVSSENMVHLFKVVDGVYQNLGVATITYADDAVLQLTPAADFQSWTVTYDGTVAISATSVTDFAAEGIWHAGLLNTYDAGDTSVVGFGDFSATRVEGAPPF